MAFGVFDRSGGDTSLSRRSLLRGSAWLSAGAAMSTLPIASNAFAHPHAHSNISASQWPSVMAAIEDYVSNGKVANMLATFGWGQGAMETLVRGEIAFGSGVAADADSLYRIYSQTKPITGMATMMLIEDGKLTLDTPLSDILPAFANMMVQKEYDGGIGEDNLEPAKTQITIRHLLTHTAGLGYGIVQTGPIKTYYEDNGLIPGQVSRLPIPGLGRGTPLDSLEAFADGLAKAPLVYQPGTKWSYSVSLDLMGRVIEVVSGMPFDQFLQTRLFDPCGMNSTYFQVPASEAGRLTTNYGILNGTPLPIDPGASSIYLDEPAYPFGGAGLASSANDYDRFQRMLVGYGEIDGTRVMSKEIVAIATSDILPESVDVAGSWVAGQRFGAGGRVTGTAFGWGGAAGTAAFADMKSGLRAAMFTQYMPSTTYDIQQEFPKLVVADLAKMQAE